MHKFDKRVSTPLGTLYLSEALIIFTGIVIVIAMLIHASTVTQYVVASIAAISGAYATYDLSQPSKGDWNLLGGLFGLIALGVVVVMMIVYATTLF